MRLKHLSIRNIASIESGEIDFESGLRDAVTGEQSALFLISGDTGSGKTVILDCISMALYRQTPRQSSVANKRGNAFRYSRHETLDVDDIEQYTRIGISPKDECYSELTFIGNDGETYVARLELGMKRKNGAGAGAYQHKGSVWTLRRGNSAPVRGVDEVRSTILKAIGITFEQFGRMAMLAQGQFASFLTGEKSEREAILEQLTDTERFSRYGAAITRINSAAKIEAEKTGDALSRIAARRLDAEARAILEKERSKLDDSIAQLGGTRRVLEDVKGKWDRLITANRRHDDEMLKIPALHAEYILLYAELQLRVKRGLELMRQAELEREWLDAHKLEGDAVAQASVSELRMRDYHTYVARAARDTSEAKIVRERDASLRKSADESEKDRLEAERMVKEKQDEIDKVNGRLKLLDPKSLSRRLTDLKTTESSLHNLAVKITDRGVRHKDISLRQSAQAGREARLVDLRAALDEAAKRVAQAKEIEEAALQLHDLMEKGMEEALVGLRAKLHSTHAGTCPLCGQHVSHGHLEEAEKSVMAALDPARVNHEKARKAYDEANAIFLDLKGRTSSLEGEIKSEAKRIASDIRRLAEIDSDINGEFQRLAIDTSLPAVAGPHGEGDYRVPAEAVKKRSEKLEGELSDVRRLLDEVAKVNGELSALNEERKKLDKILRDVTATRDKAAGARDDNKTRGDNLERQAATARDEAARIKMEMPGVVVALFPQWQNEMQPAIDSLHQLVDTYTTHQKAFEAALKDSEKINDLAAEFQQLRDNVLNLFPSWTEVPEMGGELFGNARHRWNRLCGDCVAVTNALKRYAAEIEENMEAVIAFCHSDDMAGEASRPEDAVPICPDHDGDTAAEEVHVHTLDEIRLRIARNDAERDNLTGRRGAIDEQLKRADADEDEYRKALDADARARKRMARWALINGYFGGARFRTLVQSYILRPLLNNANIYLSRITDRYMLTCSEENEQLSILVLDRYNKDQVRSATVLSGGERFMVSLALSLALSSLNRHDLNVDILFIDEGFGTLDEKSLDSVMATLERLRDIAGQGSRRVGIISHREELRERIPVQINVRKYGEGRSRIEFHGVK